MDEFNLSGKTAVITGGGNGIGRSISLRFAEKGARVHILDVAGEAAARVQDGIQRDGGLASAYLCDVCDQRAVKEIFCQIAEGDGRIDVLVNNAGVADVGTAEDTSEEAFDRVFQVNVKGVYNCLKAAIPFMKAMQQGVILNMASVAANIGLPERFAYSMSKAAVWNMTMTTARDYLEHGIRCNSISPARVHTPFVDGYLAEHYPGNEKEMFEKLSKTQPIGRMGHPREIADLALFLCSDEAGFVTGTDFPIDGGFIKLNT